MGHEYEIIQSERKSLVRVTCDKCGHSFKQVTDAQWNHFGPPYSLYHEPGFEDHFYVKNFWGYGTKKDGETHECVLCEPCYDSVFEGIAVKITRSGVSVDLEDFQ